MKRHQHRILGTLSGFDRILFRGTLRSISYVQGAEAFRCWKGILLKDFIPFMQACTKDLVAHAEQVAKEAGRPYIYLKSSSIRKEDVAREIAERDHVHRGLICVLYAVEPCVGFDVYRNREKKKLELVSRPRKCRFFYFYFVDREFGLMHIRLQSWFPFQLQVCLNGRSYLARQMDREGIAYERDGNSFPYIEDLPRAQQLLDRLNRRNWARTFGVLARRVNPLLEGRLRGVFPYYWSIRQSEVASDIIFKDRSSLQEVYPHLWQHAIAHFSSKDVMRFLGKRMTRAFRGEAVSDVKHRPEGLRIRHAIEGNSIKMYDKGGRVLRVETTINHPRWFRVLRKITREGEPALAWRHMSAGVRDTGRRVEVSLAANARYLDALAVVGERTPSHRILDSVSMPAKKGRCRYRPLHPICPQEAALFEAVLHGEHLLHGLSNRSVRGHLFPAPAPERAERRRRSAYVSRMLRLLRAHGLLRKVPRRHLYRITPRGHQVMTTALLFRHTDVRLLMPPRAA